MLNQSVLELKEISKKFGDRQVLTKISYQFYPQRMYGLVGPSGAGKSTILRILDLLENPTEGEIFYRGKPVGAGRSERLKMRRRIGMVFQQPVLFSGTVLDNIFYGLKVRGEKFAENKDKLEDILKLVGLEEMEKQKATTLSGGEAQRLALARVMVLEPEVLLLDEPTANLDPTNVNMIEKVLLEIRERYGTTIIIVTHNLFQAKRLVDEVLLIYDGRLVEAKPADEMFRSPEHPLSQSFIRGEIAF
ncbi:MAG: phosphate ABC transporter ATP-binding protein [Desulfitobacteriaceae bacterium]|nr:phosphate ABC transporter ATP-binding protein [Desulfitobacteriaceae bacterium]